MKTHLKKAGMLALLTALASASLQAQVPIPSGSNVTPDTSKPGFIWRIFSNPANQANSTQRTEDGLAGLLKDTDGNLLPNLADPAAQGVALAPSTAPSTANATISFEIPGVINLNQVGGGSAGNFPDDGQEPGVPATDGSMDGMSVEIITYLDLPAGTTKMGINSDDGFRVSAGNVRDAFGRVVPGEFSGGRGAADSIFDISVDKAGVYPFRTTYEEGGGDSNIEWFTVKPDGTKVLVNDITNGGIKAYRALIGSATAEAVIQSVTPDPVPRQVNKVSSSLTIVLADGDAKTVVDSSIVLQVDGQTITPTTSRQGKLVTLVYTPTGLQIPTDKHTASLSFKDSAGGSRTQTWTFYNLKNIVLPAAKITEDFDSYPEDTQPTGWKAWNFTAKCDDTRDPANQSSASFEDWVLVSVANAPSIDGGVLNVAPGQTFNGQPVTSISSGNILYGESDSRCGNSDPGDGSNWGQTQFIVSKAFDCSQLSSVVLTFSSLYTQNQDSYGGVEYSIDGGTNWLPVVYFLDGPDIILNADGTVDALNTFVSTNRNRDTSGWFDNGVPKGAAPGGHGYGDGVGADITQALGLYVAPRVNDDQTEGARIEVYRLAKAGGKKDVRLRFSAMGTDSWWFAVDNIAFYDVPDTTTPPPASGNPAELGQTVNGFQDDFTGTTRDPNWLPVGPGGDLYKQEGGVLKVSVTAGDPNHLLYVGAGGSNTVEEVLARIRVVNFGVGDPSRAGIGVGVSTNKGGNLSQGVNLHFRDNAQDNVPGRQFKMLDDGRAWGPPGLRTNIPGQTGLGWSNDTWYWLRLRLDPKGDGTNTAYGKVWVADGTTPEPSTWQLTWKDSAIPKPVRSGFAGITGSSIAGLGQFEVDYILIKSAGLPSINVNFAPTGPATKTAPSFTSSALDAKKTSVVLDWFGGGTLQYADQILGPWTTATNALPPLTVPLTGAKAVGPQRFYRFAETVLKVTMSGAAEKPNAVTTAGTGSGSLTIVGNTLTYNIAFSGLSGPATAAHIHGPADASTAAGVMVGLTAPSAAAGTLSGTIDLTTLTAAQVAAIKTGNAYVNIHTSANGGGEIRGQITP